MIEVYYLDCVSESRGGVSQSSLNKQQVNSCLPKKDETSKYTYLSVQDKSTYTGVYV